MHETIISSDAPNHPTLLLSADDFDRLTRLARAEAARYPAKDAERLLDELSRADIVPTDWVPAGTVMMNAHVEYRDDVTGRIRHLQLVYPQDANMGRGRISVLSPVGTALIGLTEGQSIIWSTARGRRGRLTVLRVSDQPFEPHQDRRL
jgi:regulator of nucleoside diphosphate kinase